VPWSPELPAPRGGRRGDAQLPRLTPAAGQSQFLTTPALAKPLNFGNLSLNDADYDRDVAKGPTDSDARLMEMLQAQAAAHQAGQGYEDEQAVVDDEKLSEAEKKDLLHRALTMAASNGDVQKVKSLLTGSAKEFVDVNAPDEDGTPPLIYASCFVSRFESRVAVRWSC